MIARSSLLPTWRLLACLPLVVTMGLVSLAAAAELRTWSDTTGKFKLQAEFVSVADGVVTLKGKDGKEFEIPLAKLSPSDRKFIEDQESENPFASKSDNPFQTKTMKKDAGDAPAATDAGPAQIDVAVDWKDASEVALTPPQGDWTFAGEPYAGPLSEVRSLKAAPVSQPENRAGYRTTVLNPASRKAAVAFFNETSRGTGVNYVVLCDLEKGRAASPGKVEGEPYTLKDLHNDGQRVLVVRDVWGFGNHERVEVWRIAGSRTSKQISFVPYADKEGGQRDVNWARFSGDGRLATLAGGELVIWDMDPLKPALRCSINGFCTPAFSPDGRFLAYADEKNVGLVDLESEQCVGILPLPAEGKIAHPRLAFSPDGMKLALLSWDWLYSWDLKTGQLEREIFTGNDGMNAPIVWTSNSHVIVGSENLIDLTNNLKLWKYQSPPGTRTQPLAADGWTFFPVPPGHGRSGGVLVAKVPHPEAEAKLEQALNDPTLFAVKPGVSVKLDVQGIADAAKRDEVRASLTEKLKANGCTVSDTATITLVASTTPGNVEKMQFFGSFQEFDFPTTISKLQFTSGGQVLWEQTSSNKPFVVSRKFEESMQDALKRYQNPNYHMFLNQQVPKYLMKPSGGKGSEYLGSTVVTSAGVR